MGHKINPSYPALFAAPGPRCPKMKYGSDGRRDFQCVRRVHGPEARHLMDIMDRDAVDGARGPQPLAVADTVPCTIPNCGLGGLYGLPVLPPHHHPKGAF